MTPEEKQIVQQTWEKVTPIADQAAAMFYARLFEVDPSTKALFRADDMAEQRVKLVQILSAAVAGLDHLEKLMPVVEDLGRRHAGYGVRDGHYTSVGAALLWTLERGLGAAWSPEAEGAWTKTYGILSGVMQDAAHAVSPGGSGGAAQT